MSDSVPQVAKIKLKVGSMELEYEGDPAFLTGGIEALLVTMGGLVGKVPDDPPPAPDAAAQVPPANATGKSGAATTANAANGQQVATATIAAHLDAKTCPELVVAALATLEIVQGKSGASRSEISSEMKSATGYFKSTMRGGNLTQAFSSLTKAKRINDLGGGRFSLNATERKTLEAKVAAI